MFLSLEIACSVNAVRGGCGSSAGQVGVGGWGPEAAPCSGPKFPPCFPPDAALSDMRIDCWNTLSTTQFVIPFPEEKKLSLITYGGDDRILESKSLKIGLKKKKLIKQIFLFHFINILLILFVLLIKQIFLL